MEKDFVLVAFAFNKFKFQIMATSGRNPFKTYFATINLYFLLKLPERDESPQPSPLSPLHHTPKLRPQSQN